MKRSIIYCTYFDKCFLLKGLAMYASLIRHNPNTKLWVLAFDKYTEDILKKMKLKGVTVVPLRDFEDRQLLAVRPIRHPVEYYWTCTPSWIAYIMKKAPGVKYVVYLDGDLYFYSNPDAEVNEIGTGSLLAVEHRFPSGREGMETTAGRFNVAFNVFKNDSVGKKCLERWRKQCLDWCYWKPEGDKLGDQKYLNEWPKLYGNDLVISKNLGVDVAPWNISQYRVTSKNKDVYINNDKLICYHFHQFQVLGAGHYSRVLGYTLPKETVRLIYEPYEKELDAQYLKIKSFDPAFEIDKSKQDIKMIIWHKLAKYLGPVYWRIKGIFK